MNVLAEHRLEQRNRGPVCGIESTLVANPLRIDFFLVPDFSMLTVSAAIEPLRRANAVSGVERFRFRTVSWDGSPVRSASGLVVAVDGSIPTESPADVTFFCAGDSPDVNIPEHMPDFARRLWRRGKIVGGISGGVFVLAKAGILAGRQFTVHWEHRAVFQARWPNLELRQDIYCVDDRIITCAGEMTSADMILSVIQDTCGSEIGQSAMDLCLMSTKRFEQDEQTSPIAARLGNRNKHLLRAVAWIDENFLTQVGVEPMYRSIGVSARQLQRLFKVYVGQSPLRYMTELRLKHARSLLAETDMKVTEIANVCGYENASHFSRSFKRRFGVGPHRYGNFHSEKVVPLMLPKPD